MNTNKNLQKRLKKTGLLRDITNNLKSSLYISEEMMVTSLQKIEATRQIKINKAIAKEYYLLNEILQDIVDDGGEFTIDKDGKLNINLNRNIEL